MPRGIPNHKEDAQSTSDETKIDALDETQDGRESVMEENQAIKRQLAVMQGEVSRMSSLLQKFSKKTGVKLDKKPETADAFFSLATTDDGKVIVDWKKKPGSAVVTNEAGKDIDLQFIIFTTEDGVEHEMSYQLFRQLRKAHKVPAKAVGYLAHNEFNQWIPAHKYKYNDEIEMQVGRYTEEVEESGNPGKDFSNSRTVKVKVYVLNP